MELFLLVSIALAIVTFLLIVASEPAAPSLAEHDSDYAAEYTPMPEESMAEMQELAMSISDSASPASQNAPSIQLAI